MKQSDAAEILGVLWFIFALLAPEGHHVLIGVGVGLGMLAEVRAIVLTLRGK